MLCVMLGQRCVKKSGTRTLERVGRIGRVRIFLLIKHSAWYFPGRVAGIQLTAGL
jgi:hypothetical protein